MPRFRYPVPPASEMTDASVYQRRREFVAGLAAALPTALLLPACAREASGDDMPSAPALPTPRSLVPTQRRSHDRDEPQTRWEDATTYNNYYEFGTGKDQPWKRSGRFKPEPWTVEIAGHAAKTGRFAVEDVLKRHGLEERVYRMRCVEAWSMVIPWIGIPLADVLKRFEPTSQAKYVAFTTVNRPAEMPGMARDVLEWPYREALRIDEAMHPLTFLAVGLYGRTLPNQNGAPLRLVVPWKYGFKGIKSIVRIAFTETKPATSWNAAAPDEYGFYANVNPDVDHPRWSQASERRIAGSGTALLGNRIRTLPFNGYAEQVASLYAGMDLATHF